VGDLDIKRAKVDAIPAHQPPTATSGNGDRSSTIIISSDDEA
jgi:hypothetical protein